VKSAAALAALAALRLLPTPQRAQDLSKKETWIADKHDRSDVHADGEPARAAEAVLTLHNVWTDESLPVLASEKLDVEAFDRLVRCHYTNQSTEMDPRLGETILRAAQRFKASYIEIVSGFRAPKYQLMLRKKGHEVARDSQHPLGHAVDFRIPDVPTRVLLRFVRSLKLGGVGYYPESRFVHCDVGRVRFWRGH
jgi:uncharacterized protein YcbK (DUF882 family)